MSFVGSKHKYDVFVSYSHSVATADATGWVGRCPTTTWAVASFGLIELLAPTTQTWISGALCLSAVAPESPVAIPA